MSAGTAATAPTRRPGNGTSDRASTAEWVLQFFRQELTPYPGRLSVVVRMVLATTLAMLLIMTGHLPSGALGGYFALAVSREDLRSTLSSTLLTILSFSLGTLYVVLGVALFVDSPVTHFLWVIGSFLLIFFVMDTTTNYAQAAGFSFVIATAIPIWDGPAPTNAKITLTLYTLYTVAIGALCALLVETVYRSFRPADPILAGIADRLRTTGHMLAATADGKEPEKTQRARLTQYAMVGPSILRSQLIRSGQTGEVRARVSAVIALSGRLVELCAVGLDQRKYAPQESSEEADRLRVLSRVVQTQAAALETLPNVGKVGTISLPVFAAREEFAAAMPVLPEIERTVSLLSEVFRSFGNSEVSKVVWEAAPEGSHPKSADSGTQRKSSHPFGLLRAALVADAFTNRGHVVFALRGCLAASLCYLFYNGVAWPGINTCVATCIITALGTIGSSRQKQFLRIAGATTGGFLIALPAQMYLLPYIDSIAAFTIFFAVVSGIAAWLATSSPRLSYFGLQIALAFYLVNLQEPYEQISLSVSRDRVVGVLVGLLAMWLVFDHIAAPSATSRMETLMRNNLYQLGDFGCVVKDLAERTSEEKVATARQLRNKINDQFSQMNAQADAVPFEFGPDRARNLRARDRMQAMQPPMRSLFLLQIALLEWEFARYRSLGKAAHAQPLLNLFAERLREMLRTLADAQGSSLQTAAALQGVRDALGKLESTAGKTQHTLLALYTSIAASLEALIIAAIEAPVSLENESAPLRRAVSRP